jgi:hemophore-related protein
VANPETFQGLSAVLADDLSNSTDFEAHVTPLSRNASASARARSFRRFLRFAFRYRGFRVRGIIDPSQIKEENTMKFSSITARRGIVGTCAGSLLAGFAAATIAAPSAAAAPTQCDASAVSGTVSSTTGSARAYLDTHPDANQAVTTAFGQPRPQAAATLRAYFTANPQEYYDLRGILAPIGDLQRQCNFQALPPALASAYDEFMAG